jgi:hypothetical protein
VELTLIQISTGSTTTTADVHYPNKVLLIVARYACQTGFWGG